MIPTALPRLLRRLAAQIAHARTRRAYEREAAALRWQAMEQLRHGATVHDVAASLTRQLVDLDHADAAAALRPYRLAEELADAPERR